MEGILEQILSELKEIKQLLNKSKNNAYVTNQAANTTMNIKEAAKYLGISQ